jgi:hypothetical protein
MKVVPGRARLTYEALFQKPYFEIGANSVATIQSLYDTFAPYGLLLGDIGINNGPPLSSVCYTAPLTKNMGTVRLSLDRYSLEMHLPQVSDDALAHALAMIQATQSVAQFVAPDLALRVGNVQFMQWYEAPSMADALTWLEQCDHSLPAKFTQAVEADQVDYVPNLRLRSNAQLWSASFYAERATVAPFHLFVNYTGTYLDDGKYKEISERAAHVQSLYAAAFEVWGLEPVDSLSVP